MEELFVIVIEDGDETEGGHRKDRFPDVLHIFSEVDERDHSFRVKEDTQVGHVFDAYYKKTGIPVTEHDVFRCETNGENLGRFRDYTLARLRSEGHCGQLVWIFRDRPRDYTIFVNGEAKLWDKKEISYDQIVKLAFPTPLDGQSDYTVAYREGPHKNPSGHMTERAKTVVEVKNGMIFDVEPTIQS